MKRYGRVLFGIAISILALWLLLREVDLAEVQDALFTANYWWFIPALLVLTVSNIARARRWQVLLEDKLSLARMFWITNIGYLLSNVLPFRLGELGRVWLATRGGEVSGMQALSTGILERFIDVLTVFAFMALVLPLAPQRGPIIQAATGAAVVAFVGVFGFLVASYLREWVVGLATSILERIRPALVPPLVGRLDSFLGALVAARRGNRLWRSIFWSAVIWILSSLSMWLIMLAFIPNAGLHVAIMATCIGALGLGLPSSPAGVGVFEGAVVAALLLFGIDESTGFAFALTTHIINFVLIATLGVIGLETEKVKLGEVASSAQSVMASFREREDLEEVPEAS